MKFLTQLFRDLSHYLDRPDAVDERVFERRMQRIGSKIAGIVPLTR